MHAVKFKKGDKVVCIKEVGFWNYYEVGKIYTVLTKSEFHEQYYSVEHKNASFRDEHMRLATKLEKVLK